MKIFKYKINIDKIIKIIISVHQEDKKMKEKILNEIVENSIKLISYKTIKENYNEIEKAVEAGIMTSNPYKDKGFIPGNYSKENYFCRSN